MYECVCVCVRYEQLSYERYKAIYLIHETREVSRYVGATAS